MADGKNPRKRMENDPPSDDALNLSDAEVEISLICLRYFRGDWDMYLDYLQGPRVTDSKRRREIPIVEQLRDRDRRTDYLTYFVEDEVVATVQKLSFNELIRIWEECLLLHPDADPFSDEIRPAEDEAGQSDAAQDVPPTLH